MSGLSWCAGQGRRGRWRADRARLILASAEGMSNGGAAHALEVAVKSVLKWRRQVVGNYFADTLDPGSPS